MKHILFPAEIRDASPVGGKARALAEATGADLPVPEWFALLPSAFEPGAGADEARLVPEAAGELARALESLDAARDALFAVRSSAVQEDSARLSFAGQLESFLHVPRAEVAARTLAVCASGWSERSASYRRTLGANAPTAPAVIVQRMVDGEASGVAFSADPVSGRRAVAVVAAVPGLASALVSGETSADTWRVDRDGRIVERDIETKEVVHRRAGPGGVAAAAPTPAEAREPAIDDATAIGVAALARAAERHFGLPQDIEWTRAAGRLYLLQSRPITTLAQRPDPDAPRALWDNSNIVESYGGITTPLTFSFARRAYESVYREFCRLVRMPQEAIESHSAMFGCMLGLIRGRVYYNLYNWYRLVAVIPGYRANRRFMEQMMGVRESLPEDVAAGQRAVDTGSRARDAWRLAISLAALARHLAGLRGLVRRFERRLEEALGEGVNLAAMRPDELVAHYRDVESRLLAHWDAPIVNDFATMLFHGLLRRACAAWIPEAGESLHNDLLCAEPGMVSEEPARLVRSMGALAMGDATLVAALCEETPAGVRRAVSRHAELDWALRDYLERFGDRCMEELKLESATLHDDPTPLYRAVGSCAAALAEGPGPAYRKDVSIRQDAERRAYDALARRPLRRAAFRWILRRARECVRMRENLRFHRTRVFGRARRIVIELGRRLAALDCLAEPRDVFYLEIDELLAFVEARATTTDLRALAAVRKAEFARHREAPAPAERFETRGVAYVGHAFAPASPVAPVQGNSLQGLACCPGIVRGPVHVVRDARGVAIRRGEILVAERTDPGWVMIFPGAAGLLVERGSLLSHSAIVARELGLPAIVSLPGLTSWVKDGDWVEMDGATGAVVKVEAADGPARAHAD